MATTVLRKQNLLTNCRHFISSNGPIYQNHIGTQQQHYAKHYSKFSNFFRRTGKDIHSPATAVFTSPVSGFSSLSCSSVARVFSRIGFVGWYLGMINSRPLLTKSITSSVIYVVSDLTSQTIALPSSEPYDLIRTSRMAGYGLLVLGPTLHYWFNFMSKVLPGRDVLTTVKKMALGQTVYGPIMTAIFFTLNAALQGENATEIVARLRRDFFPAMLNCVIYWPFCDFVTFRFAPVHLQPLVSNWFSFVWTVYMTYMASLEKAIE
ncbi:hypothetical protein RND81_07G049800 [Saponaria officinalis]|uniref:Uncharacterized protein n=1 Tax=Saponaria officinalis TaxID=3572 RepID=A0AAW1JM92_SAPOF